MQKEQKYKIRGDRLKELRETKTKGQKRKNMSQVEFGEQFRFDKQTIGRYERYSPEIPKSTIEKFAEYFKVPVAYLTGETDIKDRMEYYASLEAAELEGLDQYEAEQRAARARRENFFAMCGFRYEDISDTAFCDFGGIACAPGSDRPHKILDPNDTDNPIYLSDAELERLKGNMGDLIAFECFKIKRERERENGNG